MVKIFVLIKQVPKIHNPDVDRTTGAIIRMGIENVINPDDFYALELGLSLKDQYGGTVTVVTMGPPQAEYALREALAMGCDDGILISDPMFAYSDTLQTVLVLKEIFDNIKNYDFIITGSETSDSSTGQVPYQLSEALDIPLITDIYTYELSGNIFKCQRNFGHESQNIEVSLPLLIRVRPHYTEPRHIPLLGLKQAYYKDIRIFDFNTISCPEHIDGCNKSPTRVVRTDKFTIKRKNEFIEGNTNDKIQKIIEIIHSHGIEKRWMEGQK